MTGLESRKGAKAQRKKKIIFVFFMVNIVLCAFAPWRENQFEILNLESVI